jgi:L-iditol 2-dehydrogenase
MNYGGILSYIGIEYGGEAIMEFDAKDFHFNKLQLRASHAAPALYFPECLQLLKDGHVDGQAIISHGMQLEDIDAAVQLLLDRREEVLKVIMKL